MPVEDGMVEKIGFFDAKNENIWQEGEVNSEKPAVDTATNYLALLVVGL